LIAVIAFALAVDYLVYGLAIPLTPFSPAGISQHQELVILAGVCGLGALVSTPVFGYLGDRFGCRRLILTGSLTLGLATAMLAWAPDFSVMIAARVLQGASAAATWTAGLALVAEHYSGDRVRMMGFALMGSTGGSVIGPVLAGGLYAIGGYRLPFYAVIAVIAASLLALIAFVPADERNQAPDATVFALLSDRVVLTSAFAVVLASGAWTVVETLVPIHVAQGGADPAGIGAMFTITTLIYGLSAPLVMWIVGRIGIRRTALLGAGVMALTVPMIGISTNLFAVAAATAAVQVAYALLLNPQSAAMGDAIENRGLRSYCAVYSVYNVAYTVGTIGMSILALAILPHFRLEVVLLCVGGVLLLSIPVLLAVRAPAKPSHQGERPRSATPT
jgi:MFS transporter, DHA1 family, solute carrier family 18 (vesicular amine transporter), member 1/2